MDKIKQPSHYMQHGNMETIEKIKIMTEGLTGYEGYLVGNVVKYIDRYEFKNGVEDLQKAKAYIDFIIEDIGKVEQPKEEQPKEEVKIKNCWNCKHYNIFKNWCDKTEHFYNYAHICPEYVQND